MRNIPFNVTLAEGDEEFTYLVGAPTGEMAVAGAYRFHARGGRSARRARLENITVQWTRSLREALQS